MSAHSSPDGHGNWSNVHVENPPPTRLVCAYPLLMPSSVMASCRLTSLFFKSLSRLSAWPTRSVKYSMGLSDFAAQPQESHRRHRHGVQPSGCTDSCRLKPELRTKRPRTHLCQVWSSAFGLHGLSAGQSLNSEPKDREHICARFGVQPSGCTDSVQAKA